MIMTVPIQNVRSMLSPITVRTEQGYRTAIQIRNHTIFADEPLQDGGTDTGPTPMEMLLGTAGACIAVTTKAYAQRKGWPLEGVSVELDMERIRREDNPEYTGDAPFVHKIHEHIQFEGPLSEEQKARLLVIAGKCPVHVTLQNPVFFDEELVEAVSDK
jgi:putative redox protein